MTIYKSILLIFLTSILFNLNAQMVEKNIKYGTAVRNKMDIYSPQEITDNTKTVILLHGGAWIDGDKSDMNDMAEFIALNGIIAICLNYQYADAETGINYINQLNDIKLCIEFLKKSSVHYNCSFVNINLLGFSAGGHLALLYAYKSDIKNEINSVIAISAPTNLNDSKFLEIPFSSDTFYNLTGDSIRETWQDASPIHYRKKLETHLFHCKEDMIVPAKQVIEFYEVIKDLHQKNSLKLFEDCPHELDEDIFFQIIIDTIL